MGSQVVTYDFTAFNVTPQDCMAKLKQYCRRWDFQEERGNETGRLHLQGRFHLKVKERITTVVKKFPGWHLTITSKACRNDNYYVTKEDTRVSGPWSSDDEDERGPMPPQIALYPNLRGWQNQIIEDSKVFDERHVNVIIDKIGRTGKSVLANHILWYKIGMCIPLFDGPSAYRDYLRFVHSMPVFNTYVFDIPRAASKGNLRGLWSAIEDLKRGFVFDDRHHGRYRQQRSANIWVFMNEMPDLSMLSEDRWRLWKVRESELVPYSHYPEQPKTVLMVCDILPGTMELVPRSDPRPASAQIADGPRILDVVPAPIEIMSTRDSDALVDSIKRMNAWVLPPD